MLSRLSNRSEFDLMGYSSSQIKTKQRVADHGEVFTGEREVNAMLDLVKGETERIDSRFLEPACGNGNFLAAVLERKLTVVLKKYGSRQRDFDRNSLLAVCGCYGIDILMDNVKECRQRLYELWLKTYQTHFEMEPPQPLIQSIRFVLERNVVCGNALTMRTVDETGRDTDQSLVLSEWSFVLGGRFMQRRDYRFETLMSAHPQKKDLFETEEERARPKAWKSGLLFSDEEEQEDIPASSVVCHYLELSSHV